MFRATEEENRRAILRALGARPGAALLDLGCHKGAFTHRVAASVGASRVVGVEFMPSHAAMARERGIEVLEADLDDGIPAPGETFDIVHANQIIEHVVRTDVFLSEIRRVLKPGGMACISTNNLSSWHNVVSLTFGLQPAPAHVSDELIVGNPMNPEDGTPHPDVGRAHRRLFTARALAELARHHRLAPLSVTTVGYYPLPPRIARVAARVDPLHGAFLLALLRRGDG